MSDARLTTDVVVVGAGMAGLTAASELAGHGLDVVVVDKGRAVGGRMATRRIGRARFDHGAQHFSARSKAFAATVDEWLEQGIAHVWYQSQSITRPERGIESRHAGSHGMRGIPEHLAASQAVRTGVAVQEIVDDGSGILAVAGDLVVAAGRAAIVTPPLPQSVDLLGDLLPSAIAARLETVEYDACLAVMAELDAPAGLDDGHLTLEGSVAWVADNQHKGVSDVPAVTIHSSPDFAADHLEADPDEWVQLLATEAAGHLGGSVVAATGHRWRYAQPRHTLDDGCLVLGGPRPVVLAGEVFAGARIEGAFLSGIEAAKAVAARVL